MVNQVQDLTNIDGKELKAGDKVRLNFKRWSFILLLANPFRWKITVVANDGNDVEPVEVDRLIIAVSGNLRYCCNHSSRKYGF